MKILVTGGAGFIGSHFVDHILEKYPDYEVSTLDALTYAGKRENLENALGNPRHRFIHGRIEDRQLLDSVVRGVDVIVNFAAESHVDKSIIDPGSFIKTNVEGTLVLLEAARKHGTGLFYQISTDEVYGPSPLDGRLHHAEDARLQPSSPYAASKAAADLLVLAYFRTYGLPVVISRSTNNYGPRQHAEKFLPVVISSILHDRPIPVFGDGRYLRDWLHVKDHCRAVDLILHRGRRGEIYNIAGGNERLNIDVVREILQIMNGAADMIRHLEDRPGHDCRYAVDASKIAGELGWRPEIPWEQGIRELIKWHSAGILDMSPD